MSKTNGSRPFLAWTWRSAAALAGVCMLVSPPPSHAREFTPISCGQTVSAALGNFTNAPFMLDLRGRTTNTRITLDTCNSAASRPDICLSREYIESNIALDPQCSGRGPNLDGVYVNYVLGPEEYPIRLGRYGSSFAFQPLFSNSEVVSVTLTCAPTSDPPTTLRVDNYIQSNYHQQATCCAAPTDFDYPTQWQHFCIINRDPQIDFSNNITQATHNNNITQANNNITPQAQEQSCSEEPDCADTQNCCQYGGGGARGIALLTCLCCCNLGFLCFCGCGGPSGGGWSCSNPPAPPQVELPTEVDIQRLDAGAKAAWQQVQKSLCMHHFLKIAEIAVSFWITMYCWWSYGYRVSTGMFEAEFNSSHLQTTYESFARFYLVVCFTTTATWLAGELPFLKAASNKVAVEVGVQNLNTFATGILSAIPMFIMETMIYHVEHVNADSKYGGDSAGDAIYRDGGFGLTIFYFVLEMYKMLTSARFSRAHSQMKKLAGQAKGNGAAGFLSLTVGETTTGSPMCVPPAAPTNHTPAQEGILPPGWTRETNDEGQVYYIDHASKASHWTLPTVASPAATKQNAKGSKTKHSKAKAATKIAKSGSIPQGYAPGMDIYSAEELGVCTYVGRKACGAKSIGGKLYCQTHLCPECKVNSKPTADETCSACRL